MSYNTITSCHNLQILSGAGKGGWGLGEELLQLVLLTLKNT